MKTVTCAMLEREFLGNTVEAYLYCLLTIAIGIGLIRLAHRLLWRWTRFRAQGGEIHLREFWVENAARFLLPALYALVVFQGLRDLSLSLSVAKGLSVAVTVLVTAQAVRLALHMAHELLERHVTKRAETEAGREHERRSIKGILVLIQLVVWTLAVILLLDNLGVKVSTFVAGLGISGIAVALAAQAVLGDFFSYFVILLDRPFQIGHAIKVGNFQGEVETIGLKTTRLRSLSGEQIVLSNKFVTDNQVLNFKMMARRRTVLLFEVQYSTQDAQLRAIPALVREIVAAFPDATFERAHFKEFGEAGLRFEAVFFMETPEYKRYMDVLQEVNLGLKSRLEGLGIRFAFPATTVPAVKAPS